MRVVIQENQVIEQGYYEVKVTNAEFKLSKAGKTMLVATYLEPKSKATFTEYFPTEGKGTFKLGELLKKLDLKLTKDADGGVEIVEEDIIGATIPVEIKKLVAWQEEVTGLDEATGVNITTTQWKEEEWDEDKDYTGLKNFKIKNQASCVYKEA